MRYSLRDQELEKFIKPLEVHGLRVFGRTEVAEITLAAVDQNQSPVSLKRRRSASVIRRPCVAANTCSIATLRFARTPPSWDPAWMCEGLLFEGRIRARLSTTLGMRTPWSGVLRPIIAISSECEVRHSTPLAMILASLGFVLTLERGSAFDQIPSK
jgi:hypothetical protein